MSLSEAVCSLALRASQAMKGDCLALETPLEACQAVGLHGMRSKHVASVISQQ